METVTVMPDTPEDKIQNAYNGVPDVYVRFMKSHFPQTLQGQWLNCREFSIRMFRYFTELEMKIGYVYSHQNIDNYSKKYPKQYPHCWLETEDGVKVDPTVLQFALLGELHYVETGLSPSGSCMGCGNLLFEKRDYCGKCEWSESVNDG